MKALPLAPFEKFLIAWVSAYLTAGLVFIVVGLAT